MKKLIFIALIAFTALGVSAQTQTVGLLTMQQLQQRTSNADTVYVVNFWATWCGPCVAELPYFEKLQQQYKNQPLKVLLISMDFKSKLNTAVIPFVKSRKLATEVYMADKTNEQVFIDAVDKSWSGALPATLIINNKKGIRKFYEQEFTYAALNQIYQTNK